MGVRPLQGALEARGGGQLVSGWGRAHAPRRPGIGSGRHGLRLRALAGSSARPSSQAGEIRHALFMLIQCSSGTTVYPATGGAGRSRCWGRRGGADGRARTARHVRRRDRLARRSALEEDDLRAMARYGMTSGTRAAAAGGSRWSRARPTRASGYPMRSRRSRERPACPVRAASTCSTSGPGSTGARAYGSSIRASLAATADRLEIRSATRSR